MKNIFILALIGSALMLSSCTKPETKVGFEYHAHIMSPNADDKHVDDNIHFHIEFESHSGQTIHHINVKVYNKADNTVVYDKPTDAHVHETSGKMEYHDDFVLSVANGVAAHSDWILEAKIWGDDGTSSEVIETLEFHVHP